MKLLKIGITTNEETGANFNIIEIEVRETNLCYVGNKRIGKDKLLATGSTAHTHHGNLYFELYCLPDDKEKAFKILICAVNKSFKYLKEQHHKLEKSVIKLNSSKLHEYLSEKYK